ncbi:MAG TPA: AMP-binding protein, partial [Gemmatimonadales bacterium]|nr:AMP-binding protein [Gemmatimonadales bacterium]
MTDRIETLLDEQRSFPPPESFRSRAWVRDTAIYERARQDRESYWADWAKELEWIKPWNRVLEWKPPHAKWFLGGKLNASANCLDRHVAAGRGDRVALIWEGEPGEVRHITYAQLLDDVRRFANVLKSLGVKKGDRVAIYLPMVPEVAVAMLACARLGAPHTVVFGGFSAESLRDRINDAGAKVLVTADGGYRRGSIVPLKQNADEALTATPSIEKSVVLQRTGQAVPMQAGRDLWWNDLMATAQSDCPPEPMDAEDPLYILYTSGTTGKPKGILHTTGGYLTQVYATTKWV